MPRIYRLEVARCGALIDDATPLRRAAQYPSALTMTGPETPQPKRSRSKQAAAAEQQQGNSGARRGKRAFSELSKTRFYTIGAPSPRYKIPAINESTPPIDFPADASIEPAQQRKFDEDEAFYVRTYGRRPSSAPASPSRSIAVNTPVNYFGNKGFREMSPSQRLESPRSIQLNLDEDDEGEDDNNEGEKERVDEEDALDDPAAGVNLKEPSPLNSSTYPKEEDSLKMESAPADKPSDFTRDDGLGRRQGGRTEPDTLSGPPALVTLGNNSNTNNTSGEIQPIILSNSSGLGPANGVKRPTSPLSEHGFQSQSPRMSVPTDPLNISSVLEQYKASCIAFDESLVGPNSVACALRSDVDIDRLRMVLSAALSCSRALRQLSTAPPIANHALCQELFQLQEGRDVITDATFERIVDMQTAEITSLAQALTSQEDLLKGRKIAEDGLVDYQRAFAAAAAAGGDDSAYYSGDNLETIAASLERRADEIHQQTTQSLFPTACIAETNLSILCGALEIIATDKKILQRVEREINSSPARRFIEGVSSSSSEKPPHVEIPQLRKTLQMLSKEHEALAKQRGEAVSDSPQQRRGRGAAGAAAASPSSHKYLAPCPQRPTFLSFFKNARRVSGDSAGNPASLETLRTYIKSLDQTRKGILEPLEILSTAKASSSSGASSSSAIDPDEAAAKYAKQTAAASSVIKACEGAGKRAVQTVSGSSAFSALVEQLTPTVIWQLTRGNRDMAGVGDQVGSASSFFSVAGLKGVFLNDLCTAGIEYKRAVRRVCEAETVLLAFEDITNAYVKACHGGAASASRSRSPTVAGSEGRAASQQSTFSTQQRQQEASLRAFLEKLSAINTSMSTQVERNARYYREKREVSKMLVTQLRFLKKLDQVPLYFPPEFILSPNATEEEITQKLQLLKAVARVNSNVAQSCLGGLANSLVTLSKPDEDPAAKARQAAANDALIPSFLRVLGSMQSAQDGLSEALFECKRFLLKRDAKAMRGGGGVGGGAGGSRVIGAARQPAATATFDQHHVNLFGGSVGGADAAAAAQDVVYLFGPQSRPVPQLQAELFRNNMRKLIDPGVLIYLKFPSAGYVRYTISFHKKALDRLLLVPNNGAAQQGGTAATSDIIPIPFALLEMLTMGPKVTDEANIGIGDLQAMRLHFDRRALLGLVKTDDAGRPIGVHRDAADRFDSTPADDDDATNAALYASGASFSAGSPKSPHSSPTVQKMDKLSPEDSGSVATLVPLISKRMLEVYFPGVSSFQQWSDAFQMLIENKKFLGGGVRKYMLP